MRGHNLMTDLLTFADDSQKTDELTLKVKSGEPLNDEESAIREKLNTFATFVGDMLSDIATTANKILTALGEIFVVAFRGAGKAIQSCWVDVVESTMSVTERHYYSQSKKARIRKKYFDKAGRRLFLQV